ncbi:MAG: PKD domain-containing protein [Thermoplasmatota archaeon]
MVSSKASILGSLSLVALFVGSAFAASGSTTPPPPGPTSTSSPPPPPNPNMVNAFDWCDVRDCSFSYGSPNHTTVSNYNWSFGDGNFSSDPFPSHTYAKNDSYDVNFSFDQTNDSTNTTTHGFTHVLVTVPPPPPPTYGGFGGFSYYATAGGNLSGQVVDNTTGHGIPNVSVSLSLDTGNVCCNAPPAPPSGGANQTLSDGGFASTNETGHWDVSGLANGTYSIDVFTWGTPYIENNTANYTTIHGVSTHFITNITAPTVRLVRGSFVAGTLWENSTGTPHLVAGAMISISEQPPMPGCNSTLLNATGLAKVAKRLGTVFAHAVQFGKVDCGFQPMGGNSSGPGPTSGNGTAGGPGPTSGNMTPTGNQTGTCCMTPPPSGTTSGTPEAPLNLGYGFNTTSADGSYNITRLPPGRYSLDISPPEGSQIPGFSMPAGFFFIVPAKGVSNATILLGASSRIMGHVVDPHGHAVPMAWVDVNPSTDTTWAKCGDTCFGWAQTDANGNFSVWDLGAGDYTLTVHAPGGFYNQSSGQFEQAPNYAPIPVAIPGFDGTHLDLGTLVFTMARDLNGTIRDARGHPVQAGIDLWSQAGLGGYAQTDASGHYSMQGMTPGLYQGSIFPMGNGTGGGQPIFLENVTIGPDMMFNYTFPLLGSIVGRATHNGHAAADVGIAVWCQECQGWGWSQTNETGWYHIEGLPSGNYSLAAWTNGNFAPLYLEGIDVSAGNVTWENLTFSEGHTLSGQVTTTSGGVPGAQIGVWGPAGFGWTTTDAHGNYTIDGLGAGNYEYFISAPCHFDRQTESCVFDFSEKRGNFTMTDANATQDFTLAAPVNVVGGVENGTKACDGCSVVFWSDGGDSQTGSTNATGNFSISGLAAGTYHVDVYDPSGNLVKSTIVDVASGASFTFVYGGTEHLVSGLVTQNGKAVQDVVVTAFQGKSEIAKTVTNANGQYKLDVPDGTYVVFASKSSLTGHVDVTVSGADSANNNITIG